jgi:hypothetical protein
LATAAAGSSPDWAGDAAMGAAVGMPAPAGAVSLSIASLIP